MNLHATFAMDAPWRLFNYLVSGGPFQTNHDDGTTSVRGCYTLPNQVVFPPGKFYGKKISDIMASEFIPEEGEDPSDPFLIVFWRRGLIGVFSTIHRYRVEGKVYHIQ